MMNINPMKLMQFMMSQGKGNPAMQNVINMMQNGDEKGIEQYARNLCKERGIQVDEMVNMIKSQFGMM